MNLIVIYGIVSTIFEVCRNKPEFKNYVSRFYFRGFHTIHMLLKANLSFQPRKNLSYTISQADELLSLFSILLLIKSFQDFLSSLSGKNFKLIDKGWPFLAITFLCVNFSVDMYSSVKFVKDGKKSFNYKAIYIYISISHLLLFMLLVAVPIVCYLIKMKNISLSSKLRKKFYIFIALMSIFMLFIFVTSIYFFTRLFLSKKRLRIYSSCSAGKNIAYNTLETIMRLTYFFIQDIFDWSLHSMLNESKTEFELNAED